MVAPEAAEAYARGWLALFPAAGMSAVARFGPAAVSSDAAVSLERWNGRWQQERRWTLAGTAHAEVGSRA